MRARDQSQDCEGARLGSAGHLVSPRRRGDRMIGRRNFITLLGGAAVAWPVAARAQQRPRVPTIGFLGSGMPSSDGQYVAAFGQRLRALGWIEGRDVAIEYRWGEGRVDRFAELAAELVRLKVDIVFTYGSATAAAAKQATSVIPIVFTLVGAPVEIGLRSEEHTSELQSLRHLVCRLLLE